MGDHEVYLGDYVVYKCDHVVYLVQGVCKKVVILIFDFSSKKISKY